MTRQTDRFDRVPKERGRVGAHRGPRRRGGGWLVALGIIVAILVLTLGSLFVIERVFGIQVGVPWLAKPTPSASASATVKLPIINDPATELDPARGVSIAILNGTPITGLQDTVASELQAAGWPVARAANAADRETLDTVVYYKNPAEEDVARGLVQALGAGETILAGRDDFFGGTIMIVLGKDHPYCLADPVCSPPPAEGTEEAGDGAADEAGEDAADESVDEGESAEE